MRKNDAGPRCGNADPVEIKSDFHRILEISHKAARFPHSHSAYDCWFHLTEDDKKPTKVLPMYPV